MGLFYRDGQRPPQKALEIITSYMNRVTYPVYLGYLSLEAGYSLARTEEMMNLLEDEGVVHKLTTEELRRSGFREVANVYALVGKPQLSKAHG